MALINGSPCAAALVADVALAVARRIALAERVFALSSDALGAPDEPTGADLEPLWDDEHETAALRALRALLAGSPGCAPAPPGAGQLPHPAARPGRGAARARRRAERAAEISLRSVTDNPVYIPPDAERPLGDGVLDRRLPQRAGAGGDRTRSRRRSRTSASWPSATPTSCSSTRPRRRC